MNAMIRFLLVGLLCLTTSICASQKGSSNNKQPEKIDRLVRELFEVLDMRGQTQKGFDMMHEHQMKSFDQVMGSIPGGMPDEGIEYIKSQQMSLSEFLKGNLSFDQVVGDLKSLYSKNFKIEELEAALNFFKSPLGNSYYRKSMAILPEVMEISRKQIQMFMPELIQKVQQIQRNIHKKIQELKEKAAEEQEVRE